VQPSVRAKRGQLRQQALLFGEALQYRAIGLKGLTYGVASGARCISSSGRGLCRRTLHGRGSAGRVPARG